MSAWDLEPPAASVGGTYNPRFFGEHPIGQDPIGLAMSVLCDADCDEVYGRSPIYAGTVGRQLDALACDYVYTYPAAHPERVEWLEDHHFIDTRSQDWPASSGGLFAGTFEIARLPSPEGGILTVESIDTYLRVIRQQGQSVLVLGMQSDLTGGGSVLTEPAPFPLNFPAQVVLRWRWHLVHQWIQGAAPRRSIAQPERRAIPATYLLRPPWDDNRYGWGSRLCDDKQYTVGGRGLVRLFVTLEVNNENAFNTVRVGGGLRGFTQQAGRDGAAVRNTTHRT